MGTQIVNKSIETLKGHSGKNIRAVDCFKGLVATGGDDGAIKIWNASAIVNKKRQKEDDKQTIIHEFKVLMPEEVKISSKENINQIRSIEILALDLNKDEHPMAFVGTCKGTVLSLLLSDSKLNTVYQDLEQRAV